MQQLLDPAKAKKKIMKKKIAFISEHASPLATLGGVDSGGQNVYVAEIPKQLVKLGYNVDVYTRKENDTATVINWLPGIRVIHIKAGPEEVVAKEKLLYLMEEFANNMILSEKKILIMSWYTRIFSCRRWLLQKLKRFLIFLMWLLFTRWVW